MGASIICAASGPAGHQPGVLCPSGVRPGLPRAVVKVTGTTHTLLHKLVDTSLLLMADSSSAAALYYYEDVQGAQQGPFPAHQLRQWFDAGYLPVTTKCAPSFYGEVPTELQPISELWADPVADAFGGAAAAAASAAAAAAAAVVATAGKSGQLVAPHREVWGEDEDNELGAEEAYAHKDDRRDEQRISTPYDRPSGGRGGGGGKGKGDGKGDGKGGGKGGGKGKGKGKGDERPSLAFGGGKGMQVGKGGGDPGAPRSMAYKLRFEAAKAAGLGRVGGGTSTGGGMATTKNPWDGRRAGT